MLAALPQLDSNGDFAVAEAKTYKPRFCALIAALILDTTHRQLLSELHHSFFMRNAVAKFKSFLDELENPARDCSDDLNRLIDHGFLLRRSRVPFRRSSCGIASNRHMVRITMALSLPLLPSPIHVEACLVRSCFVHNSFPF